MASPEIAIHKIRWPDKSALDLEQLTQTILRCPYLLARAVWLTSAGHGVGAFRLTGHRNRLCAFGHHDCFNST